MVVCISESLQLLCREPSSIYNRLNFAVFLQPMFRTIFNKIIPVVNHEDYRALLQSPEIIGDTIFNNDKD